MTIVTHCDKWEVAKTLHKCVAYTYSRTGHAVKAVKVNAAVQLEKNVMKMSAYTNVQTDESIIGGPFCCGRANLTVEMHSHV